MRRLTITILLVASVFLTASFAAATIYYGDLDGQNDVDLADIIVALKIVTGIQVPVDPPVSTALHKDVNNDNRIGMEEAVYALQVTSQIREKVEYVAPKGSSVGLFGSGLFGLAWLRRKLRARAGRPLFPAAGNR